MSTMIEEPRVTTSRMPGRDAFAEGSRTAQELLRYDRTVDRHLVHRAAVAEVFVTDSVVDGDRYLVAAQLPRGHSMAECDTRYDVNLLVEVLRQSGLLVAHEHLGVPLDLAFAFRSLDVELVDGTSARVGASPAQAVVDMRVDVRRTVSGRPIAMDFTGLMYIDGTTALVGSGSLVLMSKSAWKALRARGRESVLAAAGSMRLRPHPASQTSVARRQQRNVVISPTRTRADGCLETRLLVDVEHPYMFDHPLDHVPGNLLLESATQTAIAAVVDVHAVDPFSLSVVSFAVSFDGFVELDVPTRLVADVADLRIDVDRDCVRCAVTVRALHAGREAFVARLVIGVEA